MDKKIVEFDIDTNLFREIITLYGKICSEVLCRITKTEIRYYAMDSSHIMALIYTIPISDLRYFVIYEHETYEYIIDPSMFGHRLDKKKLKIRKPTKKRMGKNDRLHVNIYNNRTTIICTSGTMIFHHPSQENLTSITDFPFGHKNVNDLQSAFIETGKKSGNVTFSLEKELFTDILTLSDDESHESLLFFIDDTNHIKIRNDHEIHKAGYISNSLSIFQSKKEVFKNNQTNEFSIKYLKYLLGINNLKYNITIIVNMPLQISGLHFTAYLAPRVEDYNDED